MPAQYHLPELKLGLIIFTEAAALVAYMVATPLELND